MKFETGQLLITRGVSNKMENEPNFWDFINKSLTRFENGDWGELSDDDKELNNVAVRTDDRIFAAYENGKDKIWIITEGDRSATTILFPDEY